MAARRPGVTAAALKREGDARREAHRTRIYEMGRAAALAGLPGTPPMGRDDTIGAMVAAIPDRSSWLWGWDRGARDLDDLAEDAVRLNFGPVVAAAIDYGRARGRVRCPESVTAQDEALRALVEASSLPARPGPTPNTLTLAEVRAVLLDISASIYGQLRHEGNDRQAIAEEAERRIDVLLAAMEG